MKEETPKATKITQIIQREDGSEVRIVATAMFGEGLHRSIDVYVHKRTNESSPWTLCSDQPHPDWKTMPLDDYKKFGRSEMLQAVSVGELIRATSLIGKPMSQFDVEEPTQDNKKHVRPR